MNRNVFEIDEADEPFVLKPMKRVLPDTMGFSPDTAGASGEDDAETAIHFHLADWERRYSGIRAGISSRQGGVSSGGLRSMNCALHVGDDPEHVLLNRQRLMEGLGLPFASWTCAEQVHGNKVLPVAAANRGAGRLDLASALQGADGLITNVRGIVLTAVFADCVPLFFHDPEHQAVGLAHAGWRGTAADIAGATAGAMNRAYGSRPERLLTAVGPSIGPCCYEVDDRVIEAFQAAFRQKGAGAEALQQIAVRKANGRYRLNLKEANRQFMIKAGILPEHIEFTQLCTSCRKDWFFSHRRDAGDAGRMAAWISLTEGNG